jgi:hypothetical protein
MAFSVGIDKALAPEFEQSFIVPGLHVFLNSRPVTANYAGLARVASRNYFFAFGSKNCDDPQEAVRLCGDVAALPLS